MKVALIPPVDNLHYCDNEEMVMALTQLVLTNSKYCSYYSNHKGYKILDNGAYESELQGIEGVIKAAKAISASEIILPDIIFDCDKTIELAHSSIEYLKKKGLLGAYNIMAVPQGDTEENWWKCYEALEIIAEINVIGFSKLSCPKAFNDTITQSRLKITSSCSPMPDKQYHLLGGSYEILDEVKSHPDWIRSIDTSIPFEAGKRRLLLSKLTEDLPKANLARGVKNWNKQAVATNIALLKEAA